MPDQLGLDSRRLRHVGAGYLLTYVKPWPGQAVGQTPVGASLAGCPRWTAWLINRRAALLGVVGWEWLRGCASPK